MKRLFFVFFGVLGVLAFAQNQDLQLQTIARVNLIRTEGITVRQYRAEVERAERNAGQSLTPELRKQVLDMMINEKLVLQAAERDRVTISENEINQQFDQLRAILANNIGRQPTEQEFAAAVRNQYGLELPAFRDQVRRQLIVSKYLEIKKADVISSFQTPTEEEIVNTYTLTRSRFVRPDTVRFSMIQIPYGDNPAEARRKADELVREIGSNATKFDEKVNNARTQSANLGYQSFKDEYIQRDIESQQLMGAEFINTAFSLRQGEVSRLLDNGQFFRIIKVTETHEMRALQLDDIFQLGTPYTVRDYIGNTLLQERRLEALKKASEELTNELRAGRTFEDPSNNREYRRIVDQIVW
ncbi:MAG: SurA N-terminal domain-containing protein [Treponema sp.]|jgi:parvulin-like peptidyl-prolyl isomerase|nr:SurA N-terminal domain-containing protein [Treponema sp.]